MHKVLALVKTTAGFTLIELIISIVIVVILSTVGITSFSSASKANLIRQQAQEIKSLARKMRIDATALVKPTGTCTSIGSAYGNFITFIKDTRDIKYGTICSDPPSSTPTTNDYSTVNSWQLPTELKLGSPFSLDSVSVFFSFDGSVKYFGYSGSKQYPTRDDIINGTAGIEDITASTNLVTIVVTDGPNVSSGNRYQVSFSKSGLVCDENLGTGFPTLTSVCAN